MTALLELKQKIKNLYGQYEIYILPVLRCILAFLYFTWINVNMGYMSQLNNIFIVLILALICSILPSGVMIFAGFALMIAHGYALGAEVAGFSAVTDLIYADPFSEIQCRYKSGTGIYSSFFWIQHTGSSSYWKWFVKQCSFCASGRLRSNCLLFYSFSEGAA